MKMKELTFNNHAQAKMCEVNRIIDTNQFWSVINDIKWYELSKIYNTQAIDLMGNYLMDNYSVEEIAELQRMEVARRIEMEEFIKTFINSSQSDEKVYHLNDSETIDLASHIVGMGRTMFEYIKDNPDVIYHLQNHYVACFEDGFDKAIYAINFAE